MHVEKVRGVHPPTTICMGPLIKLSATCDDLVPLWPCGYGSGRGQRDRHGSVGVVKSIHHGTIILCLI